MCSCQRLFFHSCGCAVSHMLCWMWLWIINLFHLLSIDMSGFQVFIVFPLLVFTLTVSLLYSLTLVDSSLPSEAEPELRTYISRRLSKGALLGGMGNIATVELRQLLLMLLVPFVNPYFFFKRYDKMHLFVAVSQRRPLAATAVSWSTNGLQNNQTLMEMDTSFASWVALKRA